MTPDSFSFYTAFPRGYCAWVRRAVSMLAEVLSLYPPPIYVNHEIIHNTFVIKMFERRGVIFESDLSQIPEGSLVVISAHGTGPSYFRELRSRRLEWIDATCPLVEKVHREARDFLKKWYHIVYIGKKWHQEAMGVIDEWEGFFTLIESEGDIEKIPQNTPLALLTQTTLSVWETQVLIGIIQVKYPDIVLPKAGDICYATTNRQKAVSVLAERVDIILVVGSKKSSNSSKLSHLAETLGKKSYLIDSYEDIDLSWIDTGASVGITSWASAPEELADRVIEFLSKNGGKFTWELRVVEETIEFPYILKKNR